MNLKSTAAEPNFCTPSTTKYKQILQYNTKT